MEAKRFWFVISPACVFLAGIWWLIIDPEFSFLNLIKLSIAHGDGFVGQAISYVMTGGLALIVIGYVTGAFAIIAEDLIECLFSYIRCKKLEFLLGAYLSKEEKEDLFELLTKVEISGENKDEFKSCVDHAESLFTHGICSVISPGVCDWQKTRWDIFRISWSTSICLACTGILLPKIAKSFYGSINNVFPSLINDRFGDRNLFMFWCVPILITILALVHNAWKARKDFCDAIRLLIKHKAVFELAQLKSNIDNKRPILQKNGS